MASDVARMNASGILVDGAGFQLIDPALAVEAETMRQNVARTLTGLVAGTPGPMDARYRGAVPRDGVTRRVREEIRALMENRPKTRRTPELIWTRLGQRDSQYAVDTALDDLSRAGVIRRTHMGWTVIA